MLEHFLSFSLDSRESKKDIIWLTPEGKSFTAGTRYGSPHSRRVNKKVSVKLTFLLLYLRTTGADVVQYKVKMGVRDVDLVFIKQLVYFD